MRKSLLILLPLAVAAAAIEFAEGLTNSPVAFLMLAMRTAESVARFSSVYPIAPGVPRSLATRSCGRWKLWPTGHLGDSPRPAAARNSGLTLARSPARMYLHPSPPFRL